ncbi:MAG: Uncharacterised protein [Prochlorococcus marinus str. MIT 9215]|jgi:hypothetical protein|nr:MAG: Uncharacterised protein [Prochlorococcus marinus str. MIT 9215]
MDQDKLSISIELEIDDLRLMYKSVCFHLERWQGSPGPEFSCPPEEQSSLMSLKSFLYAAILDYNFSNPE